MRSLLCRWLWLSLLLVAARAQARIAHPAELGPYGSLTANTVSAAMVVTGLPASSSATVASLTAGTPAEPRSGFRLFAPKPQKVPSAPVFAAPVLEDEPVERPVRRPAPRLFDTGEVDVVHGHAHHDDEDEDEDERDEDDFDRFSIGGEALWLKRDSAVNILLATGIDATGAPNGGGNLTLDAVQNFNNENGFRSNAIWRFCPESAIEVAYMGQHEWAESAQLGAAAPFGFVQSPFLGTTIATADERFDTAVQADYNSQMHDGQLNWIESFTQDPDDHNRWLLGLRLFIFRDELALSGVQTVAAVTERTSAVCYNDFFGPQMGVDLQHPIFNRLHVGMTGKAGLFANFAELRLRNVGFPGTGQPGTTFIDFTDTDTSLGQIVDVTVQVTYHPFDFLKLRGGYQVVYARGLALAPSNLQNLGTGIRDIPQTAFPGASPLAVDTDSTLFLDGAFAGGEFRF